MAQELSEVLGFGRYEPLFRIGIGGMAEVYAARIRGEAGFQKLVAVKRMLPHLSGDQRFVDMFLDEARLAATITSPHVVQTLDLGRADDDSLYIVLELIVGVTLSQVMGYLTERGERMDPGIALELIAQAAQGLDDAHEARSPAGDSLQLVHRDVSPQNILISEDGRARVSDFGIAHAMYLRRTHTRAGEIKGKLSYFSPEQAFGRRIDRRSDVFALGVVAWEILVGDRLFPGTSMQVLEAVREKPIPPPHELRPELPRVVSDAVTKALERDPDRRYSTAAQLASALKRAATHFGDPPAPRDIGRFVSQVGGPRLESMRRQIRLADAPGGAGGTEIIDAELLESFGDQLTDIDDPDTLLEPQGSPADHDGATQPRGEPPINTALAIAEAPTVAADLASADSPTRDLRSRSGSRVLSRPLLLIAVGAIALMGLGAAAVVIASRVGSETGGTVSTPMAGSFASEGPPAEPATEDPEATPRLDVQDDPERDEPVVEAISDPLSQGSDADTPPPRPIRHPHDRGHQGTSMVDEVPTTSPSMMSPLPSIEWFDNTRHR